MELGVFEGLVTLAGCVPEANPPPAGSCLLRPEGLNCFFLLPELLRVCRLAHLPNSLQNPETMVLIGFSYLALVCLSSLSSSHRVTTALQSLINCEMCRVTEVGKNSFHAGVRGCWTKGECGEDVDAS